MPAATRESATSFACAPSASLSAGKSAASASMAAPTVAACPDGSLGRAETGISAVSVGPSRCGRIARCAYPASRTAASPAPAATAARGLGVMSRFRRRGRRPPTGGAGAHRAWWRGARAV
jgi:hypothetical protein